MADTTARQRLAAKRAEEKAAVSHMITLYCRKWHHTKGGLCSECAGLDAYARQRVGLCPFMETKTFCSNCAVHCYRPEMRERIRTVMRFSGPRMLFYHPVMAVRHAAAVLTEKRRVLRSSTTVSYGNNEKR